MIRVGAANSLEDLKVLARAGAREVLLGAKILSRYGSLEFSTLIELADSAKKLGLRPILEWDILMTQPEFEKACVLIDVVSSKLFDAVRVQDVGAFEYVLRTRPEDSIQLILETGNHNFEGVKRWCEYGGKRLERIMLSSQLPVSVLQEWISKISTPIEVLALGPVLILYTPRHLLSNQLPDVEAAGILRATASSEESFHSGLRVIENQHGTLVFLGKDYCLIDQIEELSTLGLGALRIDLRLAEGVDLLSKMAGLFSVKKSDEAALILKNYPHETTRCFFKANNTDKAFVKLKNENLAREDHGFVGEVVESAKDSYLVIHVRAKNQKLFKGQKICLTSPEGQSQEMTIHSLRNIDSQEVSEVLCGDLGVISYLKRCPAKSSVYQV